MNKPLLKNLPDEEEIYLVFPGAYTDADARARFRERFGYKPDGLFKYNNQLWTGPVEEKSLMAGLA